MLIRSSVPSRTILHRVAVDNLGATEFSDCRSATRRFGPFNDEDEGCVGTLYCAESVEGAIMESVFHDTDLTATEPIVFLSDLKAARRSEVVLQRTLILARYDDAALTRMHLNRSEIIDTSPLLYPQTVAHAILVHAAPDHFDGIQWNSRRHPESLAFVLFDDRVDRVRDLDVVVPPRPLCEGIGYEEIMAIATSHGITVVH